MSPSLTQTKYQNVPFTVTVILFFVCVDGGFIITCKVFVKSISYLTPREKDTLIK